MNSASRASSSHAGNPHKRDAPTSVEDRFRSTLDNLIEGCMLIAFDWNYLYVNEAAARFSHQARANFVDRTMLQVHPGLRGSRMYHAFRTVMKERVPRHLESGFVYPDGQTGWYQISVEPAAEGIFVLFMDVTQRKQAEMALARSNRALRSISACNEQLVRAGSEPALLEGVCRVLVEKSGFRMAWVDFAGAGGSVRQVAGFKLEAQRAVPRGGRAAAALSRRPAQAAVATGKVQALQRIPTNPALSSWRGAARRAGMASSPSSPCRSRHRRVYSAR